MAKERIPFPADIREDAAFLGVRVGDIIKIVLPCIVVGVALALLPLPIFLRLLFFLGFPVAGFIWIAADVPGYIKRLRRYKKEPTSYTFNNNTEKEKGIGDLLAVQALHGPFIEFNDHSLAIVLRLDAPPWATMGDQEADDSALGGFRSVLRDVYTAGAELVITQDGGRQLLNSEWDRQEKDYTARFADTTVLDFALERVNYHRNLEKSRGEECHLRIRVDPLELDLPRKPRDDEDQRNMLAEILTDLVENIMRDLAPYNIAVAILGADAVKNLAIKQLNPVEYQQISSIEEQWEYIQDTIEDEIEENTAEPHKKNKQILKTLAGRLQATGQFYRQFREVGKSIGGFNANIGKLLQTSKKSLSGAINKARETQAREEQKLEHHDDMQGKVITIWSPTGNGWMAAALNLATAAANQRETILVNYDLPCPELDSFFGIKNTTPLAEFDPKDAGLMTMGQNLTPELAVKMVRPVKWGIQYLPAGNKLNNIGTPDYGEPAETVTLFKEIIQQLKQDERLIIINAGRDFEFPPVYAAIASADVLVIPYTGNPFEGKVIKQQLKELTRLAIEKPVVELLFAVEGIEEPPQVCLQRVVVTADYPGYIKAAQMHKPYALGEGKEEWARVLSQII